MGKEVLEAFKVPPKWFRFKDLQNGSLGSCLNYIFSNESGLMNWIEFLQEDLDETIPGCDRAGR